MEYSYLMEWRNQDFLRVLQFLLENTFQVKLLKLRIVKSYLRQFNYDFLFARRMEGFFLRRRRFSSAITLHCFQSCLSKVPSSTISRIFQSEHQSNLQRKVILMVNNHYFFLKKNIEAEVVVLVLLNVIHTYQKYLILGNHILTHPAYVFLSESFYSDEYQRGCYFKQLLITFNVTC